MQKPVFDGNWSRGQLHVVMVVMVSDQRNLTGNRREKATHVRSSGPDYPPEISPGPQTGAGRLVLYLVRAALGQVSEHSFEAREI